MTDICFVFVFILTLNLHSPSGNSSSLALWETKPILSLSPCASGVVVPRLSYFKDGYTTRAWPKRLFHDFGNSDW